MIGQIKRVLRPSEIWRYLSFRWVSDAYHVLHPRPFPEDMMTSSNGNSFRVTGPMCGEFTGHRWIPRTKASDLELWYFLWSTPEKRSSKQSQGYWFQMPSPQSWRHCIASGPPNSNSTSKTILTGYGINEIYEVYSDVISFQLCNVIKRSGVGSWYVFTTQTRWNLPAIRFFHVGLLSK